MKKMLLLVGFVGLCAFGCAENQERLLGILDDPSTLVQDPEFATYKEQADSLEKEYLDKKITYADYLEKKKSLDNDYESKVKKRNDSIEKAR